MCERWVHHPYSNNSPEKTCSSTSSHECADLRHLRKRLEDKLELMLAESMGVAHEASALRSTDLARVAIDTPVQPKSITSPTDASCCTRRSKAPADQARRAAAAILSAYRQGRGDDGGALCPCQTVQTASEAIAYPALPLRPDHPRHPRRIQGQKRPRSAPLTASCAADPLSRRSSATWAAATSKVALEMQPTSSARLMLRPSQTSRQ